MPSASLNVVDSSAWLSYLADEPGSHNFEVAIEKTAALVVPSICLAEVFKVVLRERGESDALQVAAVMQAGRVIELDGDLAISAAQLGLEYKLPLADSIVFATAKMLGATIWTQDEDFEGLPAVKFFRKRKT